ncbi:YqiA/YcfP family alpha/beta fold hydrolase [uncultured Campylobacter sp.]|uniref:YqiA/YcfP family alpha/beta fold hydrolase n=1 Tax=uncultured Campylobacter sp. TaxID=218934 RepID=UPI00260BEB7C|nr:YqiA/YcfP family alpha/beta fold hydrolase [uncultured Campylobacter sp.]
MQSFKECLDELKSKRALIVHGFNSSGNRTTANNLKSVLNDFGITKIIAPSFNLLNYDETIAKIDELSKNVDIVIGHSLGGYYTMSLERLEIFKIVVNPCLDPSILI